MSAKFELVKGYYDAGLWSAERVYNAVGRWITRDEYEQIVNGKAAE